MRNPSKPMAARFLRQATEDDLSYKYRRCVGREIKRLRIAAELTQEQLARQLGMTGSGISGLELGRVSLAPERYEQMADLFQVSKVDWGKFLLRYSNPWMYALIFGFDAEDLKRDLDNIPDRQARADEQ